MLGAQQDELFKESEHSALILSSFGMTTGWMVVIKRTILLT